MFSCHFPTRTLLHSLVLANRVKSAGRVILPEDLLEILSLFDLDAQGVPVGPDNNGLNAPLDEVVGERGTASSVRMV